MTMADDRQEHGSYVRKVREKSRRYAQELLDENRRLHALVASYQIQEHDLREELAAAKVECEKAIQTQHRLHVAEEENLRLRNEIQEARRAADKRAREQESLRWQLERVDRDNRRYSDEFVQLEQQNNNLANLYVASYRLHGTLDRQEVITALKEIIVNLVGSEEIALFEMDASGLRLTLLDSNGIQPECYQSVPVGSGLIGKAALSGELLIAGNGDERTPGEDHLSAAIPLKLEDQVTGLIAIFRLLPQKSGIEELDREIFDLLASHAAMALYCSALRARLKQSGGDAS
jgi:hypothetical protein